MEVPAACGISSSTPSSAPVKAKKSNGYNDLARGQVWRQQLADGRRPARQRQVRVNIVEGFEDEVAEARARVGQDQVGGLSHLQPKGNEVKVERIKGRVFRRPGSGSTYAHTNDMGFHIKTTLNISDVVMRELKREAVRQGKTMSELVETALRLLLARRPRAADPSPLPSFESGGALVDLANRDALYDRMEGP